MTNDIIIDDFFELYRKLLEISNEEKNHEAIQKETETT